MALVVRLPHVDRAIERARAILELPGDIVERIVAVDLGLAQAQQIEVGAVQDEDRVGHGSLSVAADDARSLYEKRILGHISSSRRPELAERSEEHTSEHQSLMRISYTVFCLKKQNLHESIIQTLSHSTLTSPCILTA